MRLVRWDWLPSGASPPNPHLRAAALKNPPPASPRRSQAAPGISRRWRVLEMPLAVPFVALTTLSLRVPR